MTQNFHLFKSDFYDWHSWPIADKFCIVFEVFWGKYSTFKNKEGSACLLEWCTFFLSRGSKTLINCLWKADDCVDERPFGLLAWYTDSIPRLFKELKTKSKSAAIVLTVLSITSLLLDIMTFIASFILTILSMVVILPIHLIFKHFLTKPVKKIMDMQGILPEDYPYDGTDFTKSTFYDDHLYVKNKNYVNQWENTFAYKTKKLSGLENFVKNLDDSRYIFSLVVIVNERWSAQRETLQTLAINKATYTLYSSGPGDPHISQADRLPLALIPINKDNKSGILALLERAEKMEKCEIEHSLVDRISNALERPSLADDADKITHVAYSYIAQNSKTPIPLELYELIAQYTFFGTNEIDRRIGTQNDQPENQKECSFFKTAYKKFKEMHDINDIIATGESISMKN